MKVPNIHFGAPTSDASLALLPGEAARAANLRTRLNPFAPAEIALLLRAGHAGADASLRKRGITQSIPPASFAGLVE